MVLSQDDIAVLTAFEYILKMTDESDWNMIHNTVRDRVKEGRMSKELEKEYKIMVDNKLKEQNK